MQGIVRAWRVLTLKKNVMKEVFEKLNRREEHLRNTGIESPDDFTNTPASDDFHRIKFMDVRLTIHLI